MGAASPAAVISSSMTRHTFVPKASRQQPIRGAGGTFIRTPLARSPVNASRQRDPWMGRPRSKWMKAQQIFSGELGIGFPLIRFEGDPHPRTADQN